MTTLDSVQAMCLPLGASVSLLIMFFFFDSMQVAFVSFLSCACFPLFACLWLFPCVFFRLFSFVSLLIIQVCFLLFASLYCFHAMQCLYTLFHALEITSACNRGPKFRTWNWGLPNLGLNNRSINCSFSLPSALQWLPLLPLPSSFYPCVRYHFL